MFSAKSSEVTMDEKVPSPVRTVVPVSGRLLRKEYASTRSQSDRRPLHRNWDNPVNRRALSLNLKTERHSLDLSNGTKETVNLLRNVITATKDEIIAKRLEIKYSPRLDEYRRPTDLRLKKRKGWKSFIFAERNMELVTEHRQIGETEKVIVYLSRYPGSKSACMQWKFDFTDTGLRVDKFALRFVYDTFEDGNIRVYLKPDLKDDDHETNEQPARIMLHSTPNLRYITEAQGWRKFSLIVEMSCKRDPCVFHHTQLFLQQQTGAFFEKEDKKYPLKLEITFF